MYAAISTALRASPRSTSARCANSISSAATTLRGGMLLFAPAAIVTSRADHRGQPPETFVLADHDEKIARRERDAGIRDDRDRIVTAFERHHPQPRRLVLDLPNRLARERAALDHPQLLEVYLIAAPR